MSKQPSDEVARAIEALRDPKTGLLRPEDVVDAARDPASVLHGHFEWNDAKAAVYFRIEQARTLIRTLKIEIEVGPTVVTTVTYVSNPRALGTYRRLDEIEPRSDTAKEVLLAELNRISTALGRARKIAAVVGLDQEIDDLLDALTAAKTRVGVPA